MRKTPTLIPTIFVLCLILLGGCAPSSPDPLDEQSMKSQIEERLKQNMDEKTEITIQELANRQTEGKQDTIEVRMLTDEEVELLRVGNDPLEKPALRTESLYRAEFVYEEKQWVLKDLSKMNDISVTPKEGINVSALLNPMGKTYVEGAPKERFWHLEYVDEKKDLENGTDTVFIRKEAKNGILTESGTVKYAYEFNKETGTWEQVEETKLDDWKREYHISGDWKYKFTSDDGYYVTVSLSVSDVDENGQISLRMDSDAIRASILSGLDVKNTWTAKVSQDNPFVFTSDETSYALTIPDEGETNVLKLGDYIFRR